MFIVFATIIQQNNANSLTELTALNTTNSFTENKEFALIVNAREYPPFVMYNGCKLPSQGIEVLLVGAIAEKLGHHIKYEENSSDDPRVKRYENCIKFQVYYILHSI